MMKKEAKKMRNSKMPNFPLYLHLFRISPSLKKAHTKIIKAKVYNNIEITLTMISRLSRPSLCLRHSNFRINMIL
jgi:hypothetical protein